jgi:hypothetical protein
LETATTSAISELGGLHFHAFSSENDRLDERTCSIFVTDIPLFITDVQLQGCFTRYRNITKCKVLKGRLYNKAIISFDSVNAVTTFLDTWSVLCCGYCLWVVPEKSSKDSRDLRRLHVALLSGLPKNTVATDLVDIAELVNAKCINVPLSLNSYRPKPYAYLTFKDETVKETAMDISCAFKGVFLTWHQPDQTNSLCHICGRPNCSSDTCPKFNSRQFSPTKQVKDDRLNKLHARFNRFDSQRKPAFSHTAGHFKSRSRSWSQPSHNSRQINNNDTSKFTPNHPPTFTSQTNGHPYGFRPWNRIASQDMHNWDNDLVEPSLNEWQALQFELGEVKILLAQISQQIQTVVSKLQY